MVMYPYVSVCGYVHMRAVPVAARRGRQIPWHWIHRLNPAALL